MSRRAKIRIHRGHTGAIQQKTTLLQSSTAPAQKLQRKKRVPRGAIQRTPDRAPHAAVQRARSTSGHIQSRDVGQLHGTLGNRAIQRLLQSDSGRLVVQPKLEVTAPGDQYEQEADAVAEKLTHSADSSAAVNRATAEDHLQTSGTDGGAAAVAGQVEAQIDNARGGGQALDPDIQQKMGSAMGADFSNVRVHADSAAADLNEALQARAFTTGQDIFFKPDEYKPDSSAGQKLIGHELTHVVQQGAAPALEDDSAGPKPDSGQQIQRKVGFEFEEAHWKVFEKKYSENPLYEDVWKENPLYKGKDGDKPAGKNVYARPPGKHINDEVGQYGVQAAGKKITLHEGGTFRIESDGPYRRGEMHLEFVTKPFDESKQGIKELGQTISEIKKIEQQLSNKSNRADSLGNFVSPGEHGFSNQEIFLSGGMSRFEVKPQVTHGIPLAQLPTLLAYLGTPAAESSAEAEERKYARMMMRGKTDSDEKYGRIMGQTPELADIAIRFLRENGVLGSEEDTSAVQGFTAYMLMYIQALSETPDEGIKIVLPLMSRYRFDELFQQLPEDQQESIAGVGRDNFKKAIAFALRKSPLDLDFDMNSPLLNVTPTTVRDEDKFFELLNKLTISEWIDDVMTGNDPLTKAGIIKYLEKKGSGDDARQYEKSLRIFMRGHGDTKNLEEGGPPLAIMENRAIAPTGGPIKMERAAEIALAYMSFMKQMKAADASGGSPGAFPGPST